MADKYYQAGWPTDGLLDPMPDPSDRLPADPTTGSYQEGWPTDRVALPDASIDPGFTRKTADISNDWTFSKGLRDRANQPSWSLEKSGLNMFFDKQEIENMLGRPGVATLPGAPAQGDASSRAKPGWVQLPQPGTLEGGEHGSGYYTYGTAPGGRPGPDGQWGDARAAATIAAVADRLATGREFTPFGVGNISLPGGGTFKGHKEHRNGLDIDVRPARTDGAQAPVTYKDPHYDRAATQRLVDAFRATGQVGAIYFNDPEVHGVQPSKGHDNHFHVRLNR